MRAANLKAKLKKCKFGMKECVYLGYVVDNVPRTVMSSGGVLTKKQVCGFLGLTVYYRRFIEK